MFYRLLMLVGGLAVALPAVANQDQIRQEMSATLSAYTAYQMGDYAESFAQWLALAHQGNAQAMLNVATFYRRGEGVAADSAKAFHWYRRGADQGDPACLYETALAYEGGFGIPAQDDLATQYRVLAAEAGVVAAQLRLAADALAANEVGEAMYWWEQAAAAGDLEAVAQLQALAPTAVPIHTASARQQQAFREFVEGWAHGANVQDVAALLAVFAPDAQIQVQFPDAPTATRLSLAEFGAWWETTFSRVNRYRYTPTRLLWQQHTDSHHWRLYSQARDDRTVGQDTQWRGLDAQWDVAVAEGRLVVTALILVLYPLAPPDAVPTAH